MNDRTSKYLLGIACIFAGAFMPLILGTLTLLPPGFDLLDAAKFIHFTNLMLLTVIAITVMVNILELVEARSRGRTSLEQLPRNAATFLTGAVGMLLLFTYLFETISSSSRISPTASLYVYALSSTVLLMEACCLLSSVITSPSGEAKVSPKE